MHQTKNFTLALAKGLSEGAEEVGNQSGDKEEQEPYTGGVNRNLPHRFRRLRDHDTQVVLALWTYASKVFSQIDRGP